MAAGITGTVFDIRELTVHDGPGIRTTVFLKGCFLRCAWCHNPEGISPGPEMLHSAAGDRLAGRVYTSGELAELLNRQGTLLREVGGVTFSGGEPLMQADFVADTIDRLEDLHVTLGTSGFAGGEDFRRVAERCDLILFDLKLMDCDEHKRWTGQTNDCILRNLEILADMRTPFVVRVPLVPGVTDTNENLEAIAAHVSGLKRCPRVELLPYNRAAGGKYGACGLNWRPDYDERRPINGNIESFRQKNIEVSLL